MKGKGLLAEAFGHIAASVAFPFAPADGNGV
jgi:hypothetical protein